jgi:hypothetical protein
MIDLVEAYMAQAQVLFLVGDTPKDLIVSRPVNLNPLGDIFG